MIRTPSNLEVLLHCHVSPESHPRTDAPAVKDAIEYLLDEGMISLYDHTFTTTAKGQFYIAHLMKVPFPVTTYEIPEVK